MYMSRPKIRIQVRELYKDLILSNYEQLKYDLGELQPLGRIKIIIELSKFVLPAFLSVIFS